MGTYAQHCRTGKVDSLSNIRATSENWHIHAIGLAGILHAAFVAYWQLTYPVDEQTQAFLALLTKALPGAMWANSGATRISLLTGIALSGSLAMMWLGGKVQLWPAMRAAWWMMLVACAILSLQVFSFPFYEHWHVNPWHEFNYRFLVNFGSVFGWGLLSFFGGKGSGFLERNAA